MDAGTVDRAVQGSRGVLHECYIAASIVLLVHVSELTVRIRPHVAGPCSQHSAAEETTNSPALVDEQVHTEHRRQMRVWRRTL